VASFLLLWSPKGWQWDPSAYAEVVHRTANGEGVAARWSTGQRRDGIGPGDRGYLVRTRDARGIVAGATFDGGILEDVHWDGSGRPWPYAPLTWNTLVDPRQRLRVDDLRLRVPEVPWDHLRGSGVRVPDVAEGRLEQLWRAHVDGLERTLAGEDVDGTLPEIALSTVTVNRFERDPAARKVCLDRWGADCAVCGFDFGWAYGNLGTGFVDVHHVTPAARIGPHYRLDAERDLRPVCANCHAMLHATYPGLTIGELRRRVRADV
jgi:5-methylcytosine-specific restriction protein A